MSLAHYIKQVQMNLMHTTYCCFVFSYHFHISHSVILCINNVISYQRSSNKSPFISKPDQRILEYNCTLRVNFRRSFDILLSIETRFSNVITQFGHSIVRHTQFVMHDLPPKQHSRCLLQNAMQNLYDV